MYFSEHSSKENVEGFGKNVMLQYSVNDVKITTRMYTCYVFLTFNVVLALNELDDLMV